MTKGRRKKFSKAHQSSQENTISESKGFDPRDRQINELIKANADFDNLLVNAEIGALYVDNDMRIRKITPIMAKNTELNLSDTGKLLSDVHFMNEYDSLFEDARQSILLNQLIEREIVKGGKTWLLRIRPYYLYHNVVSGVMMVLFDISKRLEAAKYEMRMLINSIPGCVCRFRYDDGLVLEYANERFFNFVKMTPEQFFLNYNNHYERMLMNSDWISLQKKIEDSLQSGKVLQAEYTVNYEGGQEEWCLMQAVILENDDKPILQCVITDITEVKRTYYQLEQEKEKLNVIVEMSIDTLFEYDIANDCMVFTKQVGGAEKQKIMVPDYTNHPLKKDIIYSEDRDVFINFCKELCEGRQHIKTEFRNKIEDGKYHWIEIEGQTIHDFEGKPVRVIGRANDIDERKQREEQLRKFSEMDSLTGLVNHQVILDKIAERVKKKEYMSSDWLIIIDIDNFKRINDTNGHLVGDAVLCMVADELKLFFKGSLLGRIGGDEFIIYSENLDRQKLEHRLQLLNSTIQGVYKDKDQNLVVSLSIGVMECNGTGREFPILFQWADYALYKVKRENKNNFFIVNPECVQYSPKIGYLNRETDEYVREERVIQNADELVLFSLELLDNVSDLESGLKMVSDRICSFYNIDDIVFVYNENDKIDIKYHWSRRLKKQYDLETQNPSMESWSYIWNHFDEKGTEILRGEQLRKMPEAHAISAFLVRPERMYGNHKCIAFVDKEIDRDWNEEKDGLYRMASILFNHLQLFYDNEREKNEIDYRINYDPVTGLPQYHKFIVMTEKYMRENRNKKYYFAYSDFSNFQYVNERYGYTEGDKILKAFGDHLKKQPGGICFTRVNSDYFVALFEGSDAEDVRARYQEATEYFCKEMNSIYDQSNMVMISGISEVTNHGEAPSWAIDRANIARKYNKDIAATVVSFYNQEIKQKSEVEKSISVNMAAALENGEYQAFLQPKVSLVSGKIVGAEALVRWLRADGTIIYPDSFIPIFEKNGFVTQVDFSVLNQVLLYLREAMDSGDDVVPISVNFSRRHNESDDFVDNVLQRLKDMNIPTNLIEAEITESVFMMDLSKLTGNLRSLKEGGIAISIDDFGSGYSSLNVLANVDVDIIKLDKKFLKYIGEDKKTPVFIKYLIKMIKCMGYQVLAEGVETKEQLKLLKNADCDMVQGYYYAKPMPIPAFRKYLKEFNQNT
ncbi:MAG TPA: EAL domain-containing protein [Lachnospiraceae bacterium]|nr:EAL domain-containing protein [Lachnospiraceae bacterium]